MLHDGLSNLLYNRLNVTEYKLYTKVTVDINPSITNNLLTKSFITESLYKSVTRGSFLMM